MGTRLFRQARQRTATEGKNHQGGSGPTEVAGVGVKQTIDAPHSEGKT